MINLKEDQSLKHAATIQGKRQTLRPAQETNPSEPPLQIGMKEISKGPNLAPISASYQCQGRLTPEEYMV